MAKVKTIISLDESLLYKIERTAAELNISIDQLFEMAIREYFEWHEWQKTIKKFSEVYADEAIQND